MRATLQALPIGQIVFHSNVRASVADGLDDLVASIGMFGVMQPITVRRDGKGYRLLYGHRRLAAAQRAGLATIPALVEQIDESEVIARQIVENLHRTDLSLQEQAKAVRMLYDQHGVASLVAEMVGKSAAWVSKMLTLTAEGKSTVARPLLAADKLQDLELAYLLCQIEGLDAEAANVEGDKIEKGFGVTRAGLKKVLASLHDAAARGNEPGEAADDVPAQAPDAALYLTAHELAVLTRALQAYQPAGYELPDCLRLRALVASLKHPD